VREHRETRARELGEAALSEINRLAFSLQEDEDGRGDRRMTFGVFFLREHSDDEQDGG
jgi:hypothetical protein